MAPTSITLDELFASVTIPEELKGARVYNVKANSADRTIELTLYSEKLLPYEMIEQFKKVAMEQCNLSSLIIRVKYNGLSLAAIDLNTYFENLVFYVNSMVKGISGLFADSSCSLTDGVLSVKCLYGTSLLSDSGCDKLMEKLIMAQLGENVKVELIDELDPEQFEQMQQDAI